MVKVRMKNKEGVIKLRPKEKLLQYLIEHKEPVSIMQASGAIMIDYKNSYQAAKELQSSGIIVKESLGSVTPIRINLIPNQEIYNVESKRKERFLLKHPKLKILAHYIEELNCPFMIVLVFGSYAKNEEREGSDIDLCIISDNKEETKELYNKLNLLALNLELQEFTTKEFTSMIEKRKNNLGSEIVKNNIILYGIENYYNLISKWMKKE